MQAVIEHLHLILQRHAAGAAAIEMQSLADINLGVELLFNVKPVWLTIIVHMLKLTNKSCIN